MDSAATKQLMALSHPTPVTLGRLAPPRISHPTSQPLSSKQEYKSDMPSRSHYDPRIYPSLQWTLVLSSSPWGHENMSNTQRCIGAQAEASAPSKPPLESHSPNLCEDFDSANKQQCCKPQLTRITITLDHATSL